MYGKGWRLQLVPYMLILCTEQPGDTAMSSNFCAAPSSLVNAPRSNWR